MNAKVLIACEESQTVCKAFRDRGFEAYSCDIIEPSGNHPYTKRTCLWLKGLQPLVPTKIVKPIATWCPSGSYSREHGEQYKGMFTTDRAKNRAKTFSGIVEAMAEQWGVYYDY